MFWAVRLFWFIVFLFCINIALQIYYTNVNYSKVEHFKSEMDKVDAQMKLKNKLRDAKSKIHEHLGVYDTLVRYFKSILSFFGFR